MTLALEKSKKDFVWRYLEKFGELCVVFKGLSFVTNKTGFIFGETCAKIARRGFIFGVHAREQFLLEFSVV